MKIIVNGTTIMPKFHSNVNQTVDICGVAKNLPDIVHHINMAKLTVKL